MFLNYIYSTCTHTGPVWRDVRETGFGVLLLCPGGEEEVAPLQSALCNMVWAWPEPASLWFPSQACIRTELMPPQRLRLFSLSINLIIILFCWLICGYVGKLWENYEKGPTVSQNPRWPLQSSHFYLTFFDNLTICQNSCQSTDQLINCSSSEAFIHILQHSSAD